MTATIPTSEHTAREATFSEIFATLPADVLNALTGQRHDIATRIDRATDVDELKAAEVAIKFVADLWVSLGYGYKISELRVRLATRARELANVARADAAACPRKRYNWRNKFAAEAAALDAYANDLG